MTLFLVGLSVFVVAAVMRSAIRSETLSGRVFIGLIVVGSAIVCRPALRVLLGADIPELRWTPAVPGGDWIVAIDPLSAVFVVTIVLLGVTNAVFGQAYLRAGSSGAGCRQADVTYGVLVASLLLVVVAQSTMLFLCAWELMAMSSFLLIITDHEQAAVRRAGWIYIIATHTATLLLFVMFAVWSRDATDWTFAALGATRTGLPWHGALVLLLATVAFGIKAGFVPLHFWLPPAHAAAPSHVSALMSGIVIKTGIYGLLRVVTLIGPPPAWWGWLILILGGVSAFLGVLWALAQHDIKRLLAYHSVENIGIIMLGLGIGALGSAYGYPTLIFLGYGGAVLHTLNHALFKSLLFMAAGAVYRRTGTRNIEELGGIAKRMPTTFALFLIGSVAIIGVPPLNGFVSEWLVYQGLFAAAQRDGAIRLAILEAPVLALVGGLALACFAKVAGVVFLGRARSHHSLRAVEVGPSYLAPQATLAVACVLIGLFPSTVVAPLLHVAAYVAGQPALEASARASVNPSVQRAASFGAALVGTILTLGLLRFVVLRRRSARAGATWACGYDVVTPRMQYTASSFAAPLLSVFGPVAGVTEHRGATVFHSEPRDLVLDGVLSRVWSRIHDAALRLRPIQQGRIHVYLIYVVLAVVASLAYLVAAP